MNKLCIKHGLYGFTLLEMLIVIVIFSLIGLAIYGTLSNGIRIWQRVNQAVAQEDINIFFERFAGELRDCFEFSTIKLQGKEDEIIFATMVTTPGSGTGVGQVIYQYDKNAGGIIQEKRDYSQIYKGKSGFRRELLTGVDYLKFSYYFYDEDEKEYLWQQEWQEDGLPKAVRIELGFNKDDQDEKIIRTIDIPACLP